ncbi:Ig-like domain-containing protein [Pseudomonas moraviensis]|uniref:Ig-like domain-containing protein n=1 Tax=Pseudomonas moraviensis TaxID=321662 RepID=UPI0018D74F8F|nr:Ig-like domain-containing protein [Pseudomonas moraviensis]MBH3446904.1 Ig-like domain-containing protein [Pseudomonas moraviensis]
MSRVRNFVEPFALTRPQAPEMVELEPAMADVHGGVTIVKANETEGLLILMLAYLNQTKNDKLIPLINDNKGPSTTIAEGKESDDTPLRLPAGSLQKGLNRIKIHIERTSGNDELTPELVLYHRTSPPGDLPPVLNLTVSHKVINQAEADKFKVTATYANVQWYDLIFVSCNGVHHIYQLIPSSVSPPPPVPENVVIDIPKDKLIEGGNDKTFEIKYRVVDYLTNPSGPPTWSDAVFVEVDLDKISQEPPTLVNAVSPIDVLASEGGVRVRAEFKAALENDKATLKIVDGLPGSSFPQVAFNTNLRANFTFSVAFLLAHQGKTIQVSWVLIRDGVPSGESPPLEVVIDKIAVDDPRLPTPNIAGEMGQQLNVPELPNDARVLSEKIPLMQQTHPVWVDLEGVDADGNPVTNEISSGGRSELADRISLLAQVEWLKKLKDGSPLRVVCAVNLDGIKNKTDAVPLRVRTYTVSVVKALEIDTTPMVLDGFSLQPIAGLSINQNYDYPDNTAIRHPSGGTPPYIYTSSQTNIATVDSNGKVIGKSNGQTTIVVTDAVRSTVSYTVQVSNTFRLVRETTHVAANLLTPSWWQSRGWTPLTGDMITKIHLKHPNLGDLTQANLWPYPSTWTHLQCCAIAPILNPAPSSIILVVVAAGGYGNDFIYSPGTYVGYFRYAVWGIISL